MHILWFAFNTRLTSPVSPVIWSGKDVLVPLVAGLGFQGAHQGLEIFHEGTKVRSLAVSRPQNVSATNNLAKVADVHGLHHVVETLCSVIEPEIRKNSHHVENQRNI